MGIPTIERLRQGDEESPFLDFPPVFILFILSTVLFGLPTAYISFVMLLSLSKHTSLLHLGKENIGSLQLTYNPCIT